MNRKFFILAVVLCCIRSGCIVYGVVDVAVCVVCALVCFGCGGDGSCEFCVGDGIISGLLSVYGCYERCCSSRCCMRKLIRISRCG